MQALTLTLFWRCPRDNWLQCNGTEEVKKQPVKRMKLTERNSLGEAGVFVNGKVNGF